MERNLGQELEALKADYNALKAQMEQQEHLNERFSRRLVIVRRKS